jgi:hypothetical protein
MAGIREVPGTLLPRSLNEARATKGNDEPREGFEKANGMTYSARYGGASLVSAPLAPGRRVAHAAGNVAAATSRDQLPCDRWCEVIVRPVHDGVLLITQPDHAHLARTIMERCVSLATWPRRDAILHAIAEHDNGWAEEDAAPTVNPRTGNVVDFVSAPLSVRHAVWPRGLARLADDPWAAALVAQHALTVYDRFRSEAEWTSFFAEMEAARGAMLRASGMPPDDLVADYGFVRLADLISLAFCTGGTDGQRFGDWTVQLSGTRVVVTPDAFGGAEIPIEITAREIRNQAFRSDAELRDALSEANTTTLRGEVAGRRS